MPEKEKREYKLDVPITIGLLGVIGAGKSTFAEEFGSLLGIQKVEENFGENPFLSRFYDDPQSFSFRSQMWFLLRKAEQLKGLDHTQSLIIDPSVEMDGCYAKTLNKIGFMSDAEYSMYTELFKILMDKGDLKKPDIYLWIHANRDVVRERIRSRGRPFELKMLKEYPHYLSELDKEVENFVDSEKGAKIISVNTTRNIFTDGSLVVGAAEKLNRCLKR